MHNRSSAVLLIGMISLAVCVAAGGCGRAGKAPDEPGRQAEAMETPAAGAQAGETAQAADAGAEGADGVQHKVLSFNLEGFTDKGEKKWDVTGTCAEAVSATEVKLDNIVARAYGDEGEATITADEGVYDKANNNVRLQKNVTARIQNTEGVNAGFLDFGKTAEAAETGEADEKAAGKKRNTVITCDGDVQFNYEEDVAYFKKNVKVVTDDGTIIAELITVNLDPDTKKVTTITAEGDVKIFKDNNTIYSDRATYLETEKKIILSGRPKIVIAQEGGGFDTDFMSGSDLPKKE